MAASVRSGSISEIEPTRCLADAEAAGDDELGRDRSWLAMIAGWDRARARDGSDGADPGDQPPTRSTSVRRRPWRRLECHGHGEVAHEDAGDSNGDGQLHGDLGDRDRGTEARGWPLLGVETASVDAVLVTTSASTARSVPIDGTAAGQRNGGRPPVDLFGVLLVADHEISWFCSSTMSGLSALPVRSTSMVIRSHQTDSQLRSATTPSRSPRR